MADKLAQLTYYIGRGWPIFPCAAGGKKPTTAHGFRDATTEQDLIVAWHEAASEANWGMATGRRCQGGAGILVVDLDGQAGAEAWEALKDQYSAGPIETVEAITGGGGRHLWFEQPDDLQLSNSAGALAAGIDTRADGGYVVIPPSITDKPYRYVFAPDSTPIAPCPDWLRKCLSRENGRPPVAERLPGQVPEGQRHEALVAAAAGMRRVGMTQPEIEAGLEGLAQRMDPGTHPITSEEIEEVARWAAGRDRAFGCTDLSNAERFADQHASRARWVPAWGTWLHWDGRRWKRDDLQAVDHLAYITVRGIYAEAANTDDEGKRKALAGWATRSEARQRIEAMLALAQPFLAVDSHLLDANPMALNARNGTIDLRTGHLRMHNPDELLTRMVEADYDPQAEAPCWRRFLELITGGDLELQHFLELATGYTLTGLVDEHVLFLLYGLGFNGKSTYLEAWRHLLADYAVRVDVETLLSSLRDGSAPTPYVVRLQGARMALASEIPEGRKLAESTVKTLTGGDGLVGRALHRNPIEFAATHKFWLLGNFKPVVTGTDLGIWRRIRLVPFQVTIPEAVRRPMSDVLAEFAAEAAGILAWAVEGCLLWQASDLAAPPIIADATADYRSEQDLLQQFIDAVCEFHPDYSVFKADLYKRWRTWCQDAGEQDGMRRSQRWVTKEMLARGCRGARHVPEISGVRLAVP